MIRKVIKEIDIPRDENAYGFGTEHLLECGHTYVYLSHEPY